jgi:hypothetical protein
MDKRSFNYDPYSILQIDRNSTLKEVKVAYKTLARVYHPDKGGHPEMFRMLQEAYKSIVKFLVGESSEVAQTPEERKQRLAELMRDQQVSQRGKISRENFSADRFNQEFESLRNIQEDYIYDVDLNSADRINKTFDQLQRERSVMNAEIDQIKPVFNRGMGFDTNIFNRLFEKYKTDKGNGGAGMMAGSGGEGMMPGAGGSMVSYEEPNALISQGNMGFSDAMNPHQVVGGGLATRDLNQGFAPLGGGGNGVFQNPQEIDPNNYDQYSRMSDITQVSSMGRDEMKRRMSEYRNQSFDIKKAGPGDITGYTLDQVRGNNSHFQQDSRQIEYQPNTLGDGYGGEAGSNYSGGNYSSGVGQAHERDNEMENLRKQLNEMERKFKIQDKLIKKIHQGQDHQRRRR